LDVFIVGFDKNGGRLWGTYFGGAQDDYVDALSSDSEGNIYLTGRTISVSEIATNGAYQTSLAGMSVAYVVKFNNEGVQQWGTYYGGVGTEYSGDIVIDSQDNVYI